MFSKCTIFEIPHILDEICESLSSRDVLSCYSCCRAWRALFDNHRFSTVRFADLCSEQTWAVLENSRCIRDLQVDLVDAGLLLDSRCINLRRLRCVDFGYTAWSQVQDLSDDEFQAGVDLCQQPLDSSVNALGLIQRNPGLQTLVVEHMSYYYAPRPFQEPILQMLAGHRSLTSIVLKIFTTCGPVSQLLQHLPPNLDHFELWTDLHSSQDPELDCLAKPFPERHPPTRLRRLRLVGIMSCAQDKILLRFLKHCPDLEEITVPFFASRYDIYATVLREHCPKLHTLDQMPVYRLMYQPAPQIHRLIAAFPQGLRQLILGWVMYPVRLSQENLFLRALVEGNSISTLEVLMMRSTMNICSADLACILRRCPNLRVLDVQCGEYPCVDGVDLSHLVDLNVEGDFQEPLWACCKTLEKLQLNITNIKEEDTEGSVSTRQYRTARKIRRLYEALLECPRLKVLDLTWKASGLRGEGMPLEVGLSYLNQDIEGTSPLTKMTTGDLAWMGIQWSTLDENQRVRDLRRDRLIAAEERTGCPVYLSAFRMESDDLDFEDTDEEGVHWRMNWKRFKKTNVLYHRLSTKNNASWFQSHLRDEHAE
ncbi:hypothetical protein BGZ98_009126 [Dissophora globulifera]|nr:hypothetical protein BGZ98_009126 [Dissophora globulifera]